MNLHIPMTWLQQLAVDGQLHFICTGLLPCCSELRFIVPRRCCVVYKLKARASTSKKMTTCFIAIFFIAVVWNQTCDNSWGLPVPLPLDPLSLKKKEKPKKRTNLYFGTIIDSQEVAQLVQSPVYLLPSFPPMVTSYKALGRHQNQEIDNGTSPLTKK